MPRALCGAMNKSNRSVIQPDTQLDRIAIGRRIGLRRMEMGLSQDGLAALLGIKQSSVSTAESGGIATLEGINKWSQALGCTPEWLAYGPDTPPDEPVAIVGTSLLTVYQEDIRRLELKIDALGWRLAGAAREVEQMRSKIDAQARKQTLPMMLRPPVKASRR